MAKQNDGFTDHDNITRSSVNSKSNEEYTEIQKAAENCDTKHYEINSPSRPSVNSHRVLRIVVMALSTFCAVYVCMLSSERYIHGSVQTVIERTDLHVSEIPFPAVTICPFSMNMWKTQEAIERFLMTTATNANEIKLFMLLLHSLEELLYPTYKRQKQFENDHGISLNELFNNLNTLEKFRGINLTDLLLHMSYECEEIFLECSWRRIRADCCSLFQKIETYKGVCFSFNTMLGANHDTTWPWRVSDAGHLSGLRVLIKRNVHGRQMERIAAMVHDPYESLTTDINYLSGDRMIITISPLRFTADQDLHSVKPEARHCYFPGEKMLMGSTKSQCITSCRLWYIERNCNCSLSSLNQTARKVGMAVCTPAQLQCIYENKAALSTTGNVIEEGYNHGFLNCECYPNCNHVQYGVSFYTDNTSDEKEITDLYVQYSQDTLFSYRSVLRFTLLDLIVSYGGIAGLFLGISLVGTIEAIYQFILTWKHRHKKRENVKETVKQVVLPSKADNGQLEDRIAV